MLTPGPRGAADSAAISAELVTRATFLSGTMEWWTISYRLPAEPSRYRVTAWRRLRRGGALGLQQATWTFPAGAQFDPMVDDVVALVAEAGGESFVFRGQPQGATAALLEAQFTAARSEEWSE